MTTSAVSLHTEIVELRGRATFAWQSDYGQFYIIDRNDELSFRAPEDITSEMLERGIFIPANGLVIYTNDCLQQHIRIRIYDAEPDHPELEWQSGKPWTRVETAKVHFPSRSFSISSPSVPSPLPGGPVFFVDTPTLTARISWMEFQGSRDDSVPIEPDIIEISFWSR